MTLGRTGESGIHRQRSGEHVLGERQALLYRRSHAQLRLRRARRQLAHLPIKHAGQSEHACQSNAPFNRSSPVNRTRLSIGARLSIDAYLSIRTRKYTAVPANQTRLSIETHDSIKPNLSIKICLSIKVHQPI